MGELLTKEDVIAAIAAGRAKEHVQRNIELKRSWDSKYGQDLSALGNRVPSSVSWMALGVEDSGALSGHDEKWARQVEQVVSQQLNSRLTPAQACLFIETVRIVDHWIILIAILNPGDVVYWGTSAYAATGTTSRQLEPAEVLELRLRLPGLTDFTRQQRASHYDGILLERFAADVRRRSADALPLEPSAVLEVLGIARRITARLLFGDSRYRVVAYDTKGDVLLNEKRLGLYNLLAPDFLAELLIQAKHGRNTALYPPRAVHEAIANAVSHAAFFEADGDIIVELFHDRLVISNLCTSDSAHFANRWFSRGHRTVNGLLMETLRIAGHVDELGRGKSLIFSESIKAGRRPPAVVMEAAGRLSRWKLTLYATSSTRHYSRLLERCRTVYSDETKALISTALVLWESKKVSEIQRYVDGDFAPQFAEVLSSLDGPIFYSPEQDRILLTRWARILLGEGKDSKELSVPEDLQLRTLAHQYAWDNSGGEITPADLRKLGQMGDTQSEKSLSTRVLKHWCELKVVDKIARGKYRFKRPPRTSEEFQKVLEDVLARLRRQEVP